MRAVPWLVPLLFACSSVKPTPVAPVTLPSATASADATTATPKVCEDKGYWLRWLVAEAKTGDPEALSRVALAGEKGDDPLATAETALANAARSGDRAALAQAIQSAEAVLPPQPACLATDAGIVIPGRIPPEVIQRIVRQSFGRMRLCYETGLRRDPALAGQVRTRFIIDRSGDVQQVTNVGKPDAALQDAEAVTCIENVYRSLRFPRPSGGIVTVVYPINFAAGD